MEIPQIITLELFERVQKKIDAANGFSPRNTKDIYLLQGIGYCGDCETLLSAQKIRYFYKTLSTGERKRYELKTPNHQYRCNSAHKDRRIGSHPRPYFFPGNEVDQAVWRHVVDNVIKKPETIVNQITIRRAELQAQGDSINGDIANARQRLVEINQERAHYQRQEARGKITEAEFDARMEETGDQKKYWQEELERLTELKGDAVKIQSGLDYVTDLMTTLQEQLREIDIPLDELKMLPEERRNEIVEKRRIIVRAICDRVLVFSNGWVKLEGAFDGSEGIQFSLENSSLTMFRKRPAFPTLMWVDHQGCAARFDGHISVRL